jgi:hypothetical protein
MIFSESRPALCRIMLSARCLFRALDMRSARVNRLQFFIVGIRNAGDPRKADHAA